MKNKTVVLKSSAEAIKAIQNAKNYKNGTILMLNGQMLGMVFNNTFVRA
jgi:hypothetical protein